MQSIRDEEECVSQRRVVCSPHYNSVVLRYSANSPGVSAESPNKNVFNVTSSFTSRVKDYVVHICVS